jgi:hypothetical protein
LQSKVNRAHVAQTPSASDVNFEFRAGFADAMTDASWMSRRRSDALFFQPPAANLRPRIGSRDRSYRDVVRFSRMEGQIPDI